ncbi:matrix metalloproteinase-14 [Hypomesus transpacificus]|uniref:matrix metalloproteinase-14 n=1 Tax=Hypomesus transpacificus TaxID=137520 RepID=UPI001F081B0C|nr:matrix metalloproteinase-14 [Hypomesus transpacificus]
MASLRRCCSTPGLRTLIMAFFVLLLCNRLVAHEEEEDPLNAESWLRRFGYLSQASRQMSTMQSSQILSKAIGDMQRFYGLEITGEMNHATLMAMKKPRCGVPDRPSEQQSEAGARRRRYALTGQRWDKNHLTYSIKNHTPRLGEERTKEAIRQAFQVWGAASPLTFQEIHSQELHSQELPSQGFINSSQEYFDIQLLFANGYHGDMSLFDGEGGSLAHAFYPGPGIGGDTHFDADEPWTLDNHDPAGIDLFLVAVHELGHALGLEHSDSSSAIMAPFYQYMDTRNFSLPQDDVEGIQDIYGPPDNAPTDAPPTTTPDSPDDKPPTNHPDTAPQDPTTSDIPNDQPGPTNAPDPSPQPEPSPSHTPQDRPLPSTTAPQPEPITPYVRVEFPPPPPPPRPPKQPDQVPDICDGDFDTVTMLRGEMFVFKGCWFWRVRRNRVLDNYPMPISVFWVGLPQDIDAAYERHDGKFVFFKGDKYWVFREADVLPGYPQPLEEYGRGVPGHSIDTAIWWEPTGYTYFFRGDRYWRYDEELRAIESGYPKPISRWGNVPPSPRGAFLSEDGAYTYFYKDSFYWRFDNVKMEADPGSPRSILKDYMGCHSATHPDPHTHTDTDTNTDRDTHTDAGTGTDKERKWPGVNQPPVTTAPNPDGDKDSGAGREYDEEEDEQEKDVNVVVRLADNDSKVMTLIMVTVPLVLILGILILVYAIINSLQKKETPRLLVHCKRSLQDWV